MQDDHFDPWAEGRRGMIRGAVWTVIIVATAWLVAVASRIVL